MNVQYKVTPIDEIRFHATALKGSAEYARQRRLYCYHRAAWLLLWIYGALVTLGFVHSAGAMLGMLAILAMQLHQLVPFEAYLQRRFLEHYGSASVRERILIMDDHGVTEHEADVVWHAPWSNVQEAEIYRDLLILRIQSGRHIVIPRHSLEPGEVTLESILEKAASCIQLSRTRNGKDSHHNSKGV